MIPELLIVHKIPADFWQELQIFPFAMSRVSQLIRLREFETMLGSKIGISFFFFFFNYLSKQNEDKLYSAEHSCCQFKLKGQDYCLFLDETSLAENPTSGNSLSMTVFQSTLSSNQLFQSLLTFDDGSVASKKLPPTVKLMESLTMAGAGEIFDLERLVCLRRWKTTRLQFMLLFFFVFFRKSSATVSSSMRAPCLCSSRRIRFATRAD